MNTSTYKSDSIEQISVTVEGFDSRALLTRLVGQRTWAVRGAYADDFSVVMHDGEKTRFIKSTALRLAEQFIRTGREFL